MMVRVCENFCEVMRMVCFADEGISVHEKLKKTIVGRKRK